MLNKPPNIHLKENDIIENFVNSDSNSGTSSWDSL